MTYKVIQWATGRCGKIAIPAIARTGTMMSLCA